MLNKTIEELLIEQQENFDKAEIPPTSFDVIPEGKYDAIISNVKIIALKATQYKNEKISLRWEVKITDDSFKNRILSKFTDLQGEYIKWTKLNLKICGIELDSLTELPKILESGKLQNLKVKITVKVSMWNEQQVNNFYINSLIGDNSNEDEF